MGKPSVLIIEDERDVAALFRHMLDLAGYRTEIAPHGDIALERLSKSQPDIVLLDLSLPGIPGAAILQLMRSDERLKDIPVIVITAYSQIAVNLSVEPELVLLKPVNPAQLTSLVQRLIQNKGTPETTAFGDTPWDKITGLYNRSFFENRLDNALRNAKETGQDLFAVLALSPEQGKETGHSPEGERDEQVLCEIAKLLKASVRPTDTIARFETDAFFILVENIPNADIAKIIAIRILERLNGHPINKDGGPTSFSIAGLLCDNHYNDVHETLRDIKVASALANSKSPGGYMIFDRDSLRNRSD